MKKYWNRGVIVLGMIILSFSAFAQTDSTDQDFVTRAIHANRFEVAAGSQAMERSEDAAVRQYGQMLVTEHTTVLEELEKAAVAKKLMLPDAMEENHASILKSLGSLTGNDFNNAFKDIMIKSHEDAIALFTQAASGLHDSELKSWASDKIPALKKHLEQAKALQVAPKTDPSPSPAAMADSVKILKL
ncbi:DUF4142 domain-containing protein [Sphingobacterium suaedae]|uniref:DUF4142 domain-containing protein n=1 Tax=Sphingobacterium suaedae TaxID=1686402 RepID=A0ABW5KL71_9SPHI